MNKKIMCKLPLALVIAMGLALSGTAAAQQSFATQEEAAQALVAALGKTKGDPAKLAKVLGADWQTYVPTGSVERTDVDAFLAHFKEAHAFQPAADGSSATLTVGKDPWTLPVPLAKDDKGWHFDVKAGADEIRTRRIGRNEAFAIQSALAYQDAQVEYAEVDRDGDGVLEYAGKFVSTDGKHDGLFWAEDDTGEISPLGPLFGDATPGTDWHGYHFRILTSQGVSAPGGAYDYMLGENMSRGFALIAWPAKYGDTGVMSFMISHVGEVFQSDLGPDTAARAAAITSFDPDSNWNDIPEDAEAAPAKE